MREKVQILALLVCYVIGISLSCQAVEPRYKFPDSDIYVKLVRSDKLQYAVMRGSKTIQTVTLDNFVTDEHITPTTKGSLTLTSPTATIEFELVTQSSEFVLVRVSRQNLDASVVQRDCVNLNIGKTHWYGGPETRYQYWPIERATFTDEAYLTKEKDNFGLAERFWLNSDGVFIFVEDEAPLFIDQNSVGHENNLCFSGANKLPFDAHRSSFDFKYQIGIGTDAKVAYMNAVKYVLGKPTVIPDERMVRYPIWSTWALYKAAIDDTIVRNFGQAILDNNFKNSQLEIDDDWEDCYGALTFRKSKFPNIRQLTDDLKKQGFRVTLWVHPFINKDCTVWYNEAKTNKYFVLDHNGSPDTSWWNSKKGEAALIDFTNPKAVEWFTNRLKKLQTEDGIDGFKFDAGESSWTPPDPVLSAKESFTPSAATREYIKAVSQFGPYTEVRSGQGTQSLPIFVRMIDKDSNWDWNNGLPTLITTTLQMNMVGYSYVLPDMIGGNGYDNKTPNKELFIRWLQANVFMPSLQFSYVPWNYDAETITISQGLTALHDKFSSLIMDRLKVNAQTGAPVNAPLWWIDPTDDVAQGISDQFLLGESVIAAPVIVEGATLRDIYLPKGNWKDGNTGIVHKGPKWIMSYSAPLNVLPYFYDASLNI